MAGCDLLGLSWGTTSPSEGRHSLPPPLRSFFFTVCTVLSVNPFDLGYSGELVTWSNPYLALKIRNSSELYCGLLSEISLSGMLCSSKIHLRLLMYCSQIRIVVTSTRLVTYNNDVIRYDRNPNLLLEYVLDAIQFEWQPHESMSSVMCVDCCVVGTFFVQLNAPVSISGVEDSEELCPIELREYIVKR